MIIYGGCFCGSVTYTFDDSVVLLSAYCHCTNCQRLTAGAAVHSIHLPLSSGFTITGDVDTYTFTSNTRKCRHRCKLCGTQFASKNLDKDQWSVWCSTIRKEGGDVPPSLRATAHMFYGTRVLDVDDSLGKWEGYAEKSKRIA